MRCRAAIVLAAFVALAAGCGGSSSADRSPRPLKQVELMLDFTPNAVHAGIYAALAHHYDSDEGISLHVRPPPSPVDSIKLLEQGRVDFAVLDIHDLAIARERGQPLVGVMGIVAATAGISDRAASHQEPPPAPGANRRRDRRSQATTRCSDSIVAGAGGRPALGAHDHDRLRRGRRSAGGKSRGRHRVLERRGRCAGTAGGRVTTYSA